MNTILKHLKSPKVQCIKEYQNLEITELENNSKLQFKFMKSIWSKEKKKRDPNYDKRAWREYTMRKNINLNICKLTKQKIRNCEAFDTLLRNLKKAFTKKIDLK